MALSCPFCAIVRGQDPGARVVHREKLWMALLPINPATRGHTLVVPVEHVADFWKLTPELAGELAVGALRVGRALEGVVRPEGMNLITSAGEVAEQTVGHVHLHVVPRWEDDRIDAIWPSGQAASSAVLDRLVGDLRAALV